MANSSQKKKDIFNCERFVTLSSNDGGQEYNFDRCGYIVNFTERDGLTYIYMIDGNVNSNVADKLVKDFPGKLEKNKDFVKGNYTEALKEELQVFDKYLTNETKNKEEQISTIDAELNDNLFEHSGATAVVCLVTQTEVHFASVGDCRVILMVNQQPRQLTHDHFPALLKGEDKKRIKEIGGKVHGSPLPSGHIKYDKSSCLVSRNVGNLRFKRIGLLTNEPHADHVALDSESTYLIVVSDAMYRELGNHYLAKQIAKHCDMALKTLADYLTSKVVNDPNFRKDNASLVLMRFESNAHLKLIETRKVKVEKMKNTKDIQLNDKKVQKTKAQQKQLPKKTEVKTNDKSVKKSSDNQRETESFQENSIEANTSLRNENLIAGFNDGSFEKDSFDVHHSWKTNVTDRNKSVLEFLEKNYTDSAVETNDSGNTLWMGNIDETMDEKFIQFAFNSLGVNVQNIKIIRNKDTGLPVGYGFITFDDRNTTQNVLRELNGKKIPNIDDDKRFFLKPANRQSGGGGGPQQQGRLSIFVGNLSPDINDEILKSAFMSLYPSVASAQVITADGQSKGFGFVSFEDEYDYQAALGNPNMMLGQIQISISRAGHSGGLGGKNPRY